MKKIIFLSLFIPAVLFSQWVQTHGLEGKFIFSMNTNGTNLYAGTSWDGLFITTNYGANWLYSSLQHRQILSLQIIGSNIYAGTDSGVVVSTNNGVNWSQPMLSNCVIHDIIVNGNEIIAASGSPTVSGIYYSSNNGSNWIQTSITDKDIICLAMGGNRMYAGTVYDGIFISTNGGINWSQSSLNNRDINCIAVNGSNIYAGTNVFGVYHSTNNGLSWSQIGFYPDYVRALITYSNYIIAGTDSSVYITSNNGINWVKKGQGLPSGIIQVKAFNIIGNYLFAATYFDGVWRIPLPEIIGIQHLSSEIPNNFSLSQNFPNPFNPTTKIKFDIPPSRGARGVTTKLVIFDILGREIATLVNEHLQPGTYEVDFDGSNYPSGVYFYRLVTEDYSETKKMILLK